MSDNSKITNITSADTLKIVKIDIDFAENGGGIGCHSVKAYFPAFHNVVNVDYAVKEELVGENATISMGFNNITTEPDNLLNDEPVASFATLTSVAGAVVAGIPRLGTEATKVVTGINDSQLAYEIKDAPLTAGKVTMIVSLLPIQ